jgi:hypothetical protein
MVVSFRVVPFHNSRTLGTRALPLQTSRTVPIVTGAEAGKVLVIVFLTVLSADSPVKAEVTVVCPTVITSLPYCSTLAVPEEG